MYRVLRICGSSIWRCSEIKPASVCDSCVLKHLEAVQNCSHSDLFLFYLRCVGVEILSICGSQYSRKGRHVFLVKCLRGGERGNLRRAVGIEMPGVRYDHPVTDRENCIGKILRRAAGILRIRDASIGEN